MRAAVGVILGGRFVFGQQPYRRSIKWVVKSGFHVCQTITGAVVLRDSCGPVAPPDGRGRLGRLSSSRTYSSLSVTVITSSLGIC
jgi:hypothetical protein